MVHPVHTIAAVDVSVKDKVAHAAAVVMSLPRFTLLDQATVSTEVTYPYVPGLLAFRETPPVLQVLEQLKAPFDVLLADGHGRVHPRRFGLACHLGVLLDVPCAGVAKQPYVGIFENLGIEKGSMAPLRDKASKEVLGMAVRTRSKVQPVYVSVGHRVTLSDAVKLALQCVGRYRLPEPLRHAHLLSRHTFDPRS